MRYLPLCLQVGGDAGRPYEQVEDQRLKRRYGKGCHIVP